MRRLQRGPQPKAHRSDRTSCGVAALLPHQCPAGLGTVISLPHALIVQQHACRLRERRLPDLQRVTDRRAADIQHRPRAARHFVWAWLGPESGSRIVSEMLLEPATAPLKRRHFRSCQFSRVQPAYIGAAPALRATQIGPTALSVSPAWRK
jgi:hypothetical protein